MSINICIASRGHPKQLRETVWQTMAAASLPTTKAIIALDRDDKTNEEIKLPSNDRIVLSIGDREDSLGEKYNRAWRAAPADWYVLATDDMAISTPKWDEEIEKAGALFTDGIGVVYFGQPPVPSSMPASFAVSHKMALVMGFFMCPHHPFWWHDTTMDEIAHFTGRHIIADCRMTYPYGYGKTRGLREISYWATFFDLMRLWRWQIAERIIDSPENTDPAWRKLQLKQSVNNKCEQFLMRNAQLRDPLNARNQENQQSYDAPDDERYQRIKAASLVEVAKLQAFHQEQMQGKAA